ncbi:MAG: ribose 5-phosphate isomerase B [Crocinitomicaceae bacterium]|nr:ribose 5-phosphate isomerase B [Crocinitomicaceae bacterium]
MNKKIAIGSDHAGYQLKQTLINHLQEQGWEPIDFGCPSEESIDYPDYAHPVSEYVEQNKTLGVLICGSGNGISMSANKHQGVRSAICWNKEIAALARQHNNANILTLPARFISVELGIKIADTFFSTDFEGGRHERRVNKIACS